MYKTFLLQSGYGRKKKKKEVRFAIFFCHQSKDCKNMNKFFLFKFKRKITYLKSLYKSKKQIIQNSKWKQFKY